MDKPPLAERLRQEHLVGINGPLRVEMEKKHVFSEFTTAQMEKIF